MGFAQSFRFCGIWVWFLSPSLLKFWFFGSVRERDTETERERERDQKRSCEMVYDGFKKEAADLSLWSLEGFHNLETLDPRLQRQITSLPSVTCGSLIFCVSHQPMDGLDSILALPTWIFLPYIISIT